MSPVVVVTGGGRGIGAATAAALADLGYRVCVNYRRDEAAAGAVVGKLREKGASCIAVRADVSKEDEVVELFRRVDAELGTLGALVNNAGIVERQAGIADLDAERINRLLATNVTGAFLCCREAVRRMARSRGGDGGAIVNVSSIAALTGSPGEYVDYAATKGALDTLTVGLAKEVAADGIRVNGVRPGFILTDMHADGGEPDRVARLAPSIPLKRGGTPEEVAAAIAWLLSDAASYATGSFIDVAGGR